MQARPILFSTPMVQAILEGRKTQTRRIVKSGAKNMQAEGCEVIRRNPDNDKWYGEHIWSMRNSSGGWCDYTEERFLSLCPYGKVGDLLWARETFCLEGEESYEPVNYKAHYKADNKNLDAKWKPSIFMPKWASRITLEITDIRVESLQDISWQDAKAEGVICRVEEGQYNCGGKFTMPWIEKYLVLWQSINGKDSWSLNPFVWVIEFEVINKNVNEVINEKL